MLRDFHGGKLLKNFDEPQAGFLPRVFCDIGKIANGLMITHTEKEGDFIHES